MRIYVVYVEGYDYENHFEAEIIACFEKKEKAEDFAKILQFHHSCDKSFIKIKRLSLNDRKQELIGKPCATVHVKLFDENLGFYVKNVKTHCTRLQSDKYEKQDDGYIITILAEDDESPNRLITRSKEIALKYANDNINDFK